MTKRQSERSTALDAKYAACGAIRPSEAMRLLRCTPDLLRHFVNQGKLRVIAVEHDDATLRGYNRAEVEALADGLARRVHR